MGLGGDCFGTGVRVSWSRGEGAPCDAAPERTIAVAGLGLLSATSGAWSPLWLPVPFLLFEPREIHLGSASATVVGTTVFWGIGFLIPRAAAAIVGFLFICVYLAHVHSDEEKWARFRQRVRTNDDAVALLERVRSAIHGLRA